MPEISNDLELYSIALRIAPWSAPLVALYLADAAVKVRRLERALDEIAMEAQQDAEVLHNAQHVGKFTIIPGGKC